MKPERKGSTGMIKPSIDLQLQGKSSDHIWLMEDGEEPHVIGIRMDSGDSGVVYVTCEQALDLSKQLATFARQPAEEDSLNQKGGDAVGPHIQGSCPTDMCTGSTSGVASERKTRGGAEEDAGASGPESTLETNRALRFALDHARTEFREALAVRDAEIARLYREQNTPAPPASITAFLAKWHEIARELELPVEGIPAFIRMREGGRINSLLHELQALLSSQATSASITALVEKWRKAADRSAATWLKTNGDKEPEWSTELETNMNDLRMCADELER